MAALDDGSIVDGTAVELQVDVAEADESGTHDNRSESPAVLFLLDKLRSATSSPSRKRNPPIGKKKSSGNTLKDPKVHPSQRLREFPNEGLEVSDFGKLFCSACKETLSVKKSTLSSHLKSTKHVESKTKLNSEQPHEEEDIVTALKKCDESNWQLADDLGSLDDQKVYQLKVLTAFLRAGVPISKLECFKPFFKENALQLTAHRYTSDLLPYVLKEEIAQIKKEIKGRYLSIVFDASETLAVFVRYVKEWEIHHCLVRMEFLARILSGEEIAQRIISTLSVSYGIASNFLLAAIRDGTSHNNVAAGMLKGAYPQIMDICCFPYTLNIGNKFHTPVLSTFISHWVSLFSHNHTKMLWKAQTGKTVASNSKREWWSEWEIVTQIMVQLNDVEPFLSTNADICPPVLPELLDILHNTPGVCQFKMELAAVFDIGKHFVKAIQNINRDEALMVNCYEEIVKLQAVLTTAYHPNIQSVAQSLAPGNVIAQQQWTSYAMSCVQPGLDFFKAELGDDSKPLLCAFKAMRYFAPARIFEIQPAASDINTLTTIPFFNYPLVISGLKEELPAYLARAADVSMTTDVAGWWRKNNELLPNWSAAAKKALLMQPSSASSERVFSLLHEHDSAPEDYAEASVILQYNKQLL